MDACGPYYIASRACTNVSLYECCSFLKRAQSQAAHTVLYIIALCCWSKGPRAAAGAVPGLPSLLWIVPFWRRLGLADQLLRSRCFYMPAINICTRKLNCGKSERRVNFYCQNFIKQQHLARTKSFFGKKLCRKINFVLIKMLGWGFLPISIEKVLFCTFWWLIRWNSLQAVNFILVSYFTTL